jgi:hypothetical protein
MSHKGKQPIPDPISTCRECGRRLMGGVKTCPFCGYNPATWDERAKKVSTGPWTIVHGGISKLVGKCFTASTADGSEMQFKIVGYNPDDQRLPVIAQNLLTGRQHYFSETVLGRVDKSR